MRHRSPGCTWLFPGVFQNRRGSRERYGAKGRERRRGGERDESAKETEKRRGEREIGMRPSCSKFCPRPSQHKWSLCLHPRPSKKFLCWAQRGSPLHCIGRRTQPTVNVSGLKSNMITIHPTQFRKKQPKQNDQRLGSLRGEAC